MSSSPTPGPVRIGDTVRVHYTGRVAPEGRVFESSGPNGPVEFVAGSHEVPEVINRAVIGMRPGQTRLVSIPPEQALGDRLPEMMQSVPRSRLPAEVTVGDELRALSPSGKAVSVWVRSLDSDRALLDANHPLSGYALEFAIELVDVAAA